jgi:CheY-like chemotaxis protein
MTTPSSDKKIILVVDDEPINITLLAGILKETYKVKMAKDGERAIKIAKSDPAPDLILLDVMMPGMDGYEVCRRLKDDDASRTIPVVFVTGLTDQEGQARGREVGAVGYLNKPVDAVAVLKMIEEIIG